MKKLITKFWGVGLVIILLSTLFVGTAAPVAAANYAWATSAILPTANSGVLAPAAVTGIVDVAASGSTVYAVAQNATSGNTYLYKSVNGGASWAAAAATGLVAANVTYIAVAPDDANIVAVVYKPTLAAGLDLVYLSVNGGATFTQIAAPAMAVINSIDISPMTAFRYIAIGGNTANLETWTFNSVSPAWTARALAGSASIDAVKFSTNFAADQSLVAVASSATNMSANVFSFANVAWNVAGTDFPRVIDLVPAAFALNKATITLDANFYMGDAATQVGFVTVAGNNATLQGIYRFDVAADGMLTNIYAAQPVNSVAWDGTNLMVAPYDVVDDNSLSILRSASALSALPAFLPSSTFKTPGTGTLPIVMFNGGVGYAFSRGTGSAIAKSADLGKSFNGFALVNSNFNNIIDFWVSADGATKYVLADDGADISLWRQQANVWERVFLDDNSSGQAWLVRGDADTPDTVYIGNKGATTIYKSTDAGQATWTTRAFSVAMADFEVQDANTVFAVSNANANVYKSTNGGFLWTPILTSFLGGVGYDITLLADNSLVMGTTAGSVAYSADGAAFTTLLSAVDALAAGNTVVTGTGTAAGDTIFAGSAAGSLAKWTIGTSTNWGNAAGAIYAVPIVGIAYANGTLYALNDAANVTYRYITPTTSLVPPFVSDALAVGATSVTDQTNMVNALVMSQGSNVLWARNTDATVTVVDDIISYTDPMIGAAAVPAPSFPINKAVIPVNSLTGAMNPFNFMWNVPTAPAPAAGYGFNVQVYLDEAATIPFAGATNVVVGAPAYTVANVAAAALAPAFAGTPGVTYYWRVRVATGNPELGAWSAVQSFSIQQLQAIVPVLSSPQTGAEIAYGQKPAFAWNPIAQATSYKFEVSTDPAFATTVYSTTTTSAGAALPSSVSLKASTTYFWRVKALTPVEGDWSTVGNFATAAAPPPPTSTSVVTPVTTVTSIVIPPATSTIITVPPDTVETTVVNPSYIWAIIIIGAVLVIAVIVLIVRTRRSV